MSEAASMTLYRYGCLERPPVPGAVPKDGLYRSSGIPCHDGAGRRCLGWVEYTRPLKPFEESYFALSFIRKSVVEKAY